MAAPSRQRFRAIALTLRAGLHYLMVSPYRAHIRSAHAQPLIDYEESEWKFPTIPKLVA